MLPRLLAPAFIVGLAACGSSFDSGSAANTTSGASTTATGQGGTGHGGSSGTATGAGGSGIGGQPATGQGGGTVTTPNPCDGIQDGFAVDKHCYVVLHGQSLGFADASQQCADIGSGKRKSYLAHVGDLLEEKQVDGQLKANHLEQGFDFWIGLRCDEKLHPSVMDCYMPDPAVPNPSDWSSRWSWLDDGTPAAKYVNWELGGPMYPGVPGNSVRCAALHNYGASSADIEWHWAGRDCTANQVQGPDPTLEFAALCEIE